MAKRSKYSTALFEVITNARKPEKPLGKPRGVMALATPSWWSRVRGQSPLPAVESDPVPPAPYDPGDPTARVTAAALAARANIRSAAPAVAPSPEASSETSESAVATATLPDDTDIAKSREWAATPPEEPTPRDEAPPSEPERTGPSYVPSRYRDAFKFDDVLRPADAPKPLVSRHGLRVALHPERQEVTFRLRYTSAIVGGFALLVVVGLAYVFGRRMSEGPAPARAATGRQSTAEVRKGAAKAGVLDVGSARTAGGQIPARKNGPALPPTGTEPPVLPPLQPQESRVYFDAEMANGTAKRQANLNYAAIVSFPADMRERAVAARDFLNKNGVPCTVESVPKVTGDKKWHVVVGARGFPVRYSRLQEYNEYVETIKGLGEQFAGKFTYDRFKPTMFKWE